MTDIRFNVSIVVEAELPYKTDVVKTKNSVFVPITERVGFFICDTIKVVDIFIQLLKQSGLPKPETEHKFCPDRRWRFDYAWPKQKIAVEQDGGIWSGGRHARGSGLIKDMEKFNCAVLLGWRVLHYTPDQMLDEAIRDLQALLKVR